MSEDETPAAPTTQPPRFVVDKLGAIVAGVMAAAIVGIAGLNLLQARREQGYSTGAIGALKTIQTSQSMFREQDKDKDDLLDYGSLQELGTYEVVDAILASGTKYGYRYAANACSEGDSGQFMFGAMATPVERFVTGERTYFCFQEGTIYYTTDVAVNHPDAPGDGGLEAWFRAFADGSAASERRQRAIAATCPRLGQ